MLCKAAWVFSSVGLERYLDRVEVGGSNPSTPTKVPRGWKPFLFPSFEIFMDFRLKCKCLLIGLAS